MRWGEGNLHFLPHKEFEEYAFEIFLRRLARGAKMPQGKEPFKAPESDFMALARESAQRTNAYQTNTQFFINQSRAEAGTVIHESLHLFQEVSYLKALDVNANEGTTEYFTWLICAKHNITRSPKYSVQYECIKKLVTLCGEDKLAEAYFNGNILALEMAVDASKQPGTFQMWKELMEEQQFDNANDLL